MKKYFNKFYLPAMLGTAIEYYDIALYGYMAPILVQVFLPHLSKSLAYFYYFFFEFFAALCQLMGARFFGAMGDGHGRKKAMYYAMIGTSSITFMISILPTYESVGMAAAFLFATCRALQSFFLGGEYNGGAIYCLEHETNHKKHGLVSGLYCGLTVAGILLAASVSTTISFLGEGYFRLAYAISFLLAVFTYSVRRKLKETPEYLKSTIATNTQHSQPSPQIFYKLIALASASLFFGILYGLPTRIFNTILPLATDIDAKYIMFINTIFLGLYMILLVFFGKIADRIGITKLMKLASLSTIALAYPLIILIETKSLWAIVVAKGSFATLAAAFIGPFHAWAQSLFATKSRYSGISTGYAIGKCCSTLLLACTILLFDYTSNLSSLSLVLIITATLALCLLSPLRASIKKPKYDDLIPVPQEKI